MNTYRAALHIAGKDMRLFFRDRVGMVLGVLLPIALVTVFGYVMQFAFGGPGGTPRVSLWVADEDGSASSARFVEALRAVDMLRVRPRPNEQQVDGREVRELLSDGEIHHALVIPAGFGAALEEGREPDLVMVRDPGRQMEDRIARIAIMQAFLQVSEGRLWPAAMGRMMRKMGMDEAGAERVTAAAKGLQMILGGFADSRSSESGEGGETSATFDGSAFFTDMVPLRDEDVIPPERPRQLSYQIAQSVSGMSVMMLLFGLMACSSTLLIERDEGTLRRLLISSAPRDAVLWGKFLFTFAMGIIQLTVMIVYGNLLFSLNAFRDPVTLIVLILAWAAAATGFGMLIASWARTRKQAEGMSTLLILVMAAIGGCWFPLQIVDLPLAFEIVTRCTITWWAMTGFQGMFWNQLHWTHPTLLASVGVLTGFTLVCVVVARHLYRHRFLTG